MKRKPKPPPGELIDRAALAAALGLSVERVHQLVKLGMPQAARGRYAPAACTAWYIAYLQRLVSRRASVSEEGEADDLEKEQIRLTAAKADAAELDLARARGEVISISDHVLILGDLVAQTRARFLAVPARVAPRILGLPDRLAVEKTLASEVRETLTHLSNVTPRPPDPDPAPAAPDPLPAPPAAPKPPKPKRAA